jgi:hypothetical protein
VPRPQRCARLSQLAERQPWNPQEAERRRLAKLHDNAQGKIDRLLDAYTDGALGLADYKCRRADIQAEVETCSEPTG